VEREKTEIERRVAAISNVEAGLTREERLDYKRRMDTLFAVIHTAPRLFYQHKACQDELQRRHKYAAGRGLLWFLGALVVGGALHYIFRDSNKTYDFTLGGWIVFMAVLSAVIYQVETVSYARKAEGWAERIGDMRFRWLTSGVGDGPFQDFKLQVEADEHWDHQKEEYEALICTVREVILSRITDRWP
jgi:hypothetical protein